MIQPKNLFATFAAAILTANRALFSPFVWLHWYYYLCSLFRRYQSVIIDAVTCYFNGLYISPLEYITKVRNFLIPCKKIAKKTHHLHII